MKNKKEIYMLVIQNSELWAEELCGGCDLGDKRRTKRLVKLAEFEENAT